MVVIFILLILFKPDIPEQEKNYIEELSDTELEQTEFGNINDTIWD